MMPHVFYFSGLISWLNCELALALHTECQIHPPLPVGPYSVQGNNLTTAPVVSHKMSKNCKGKDRVRAIFLDFL